MANLRSPKELLNAATGVSLTSLATRGIGGWILAVAGAAITGLQSVVNVLLVPVQVLFTSEDSLVRSSVEAFLVDPLSVISAGAAASSGAVSQFGFLGLIIAVGIVLVSIFLIIQFIQEAETTDVPIPGLILDVPFLPGAEEESDPEE